MNSKNKNSSKKVYALYLAVAFFFTVFSFSNSVYADTLFSRNVIDSTSVADSPNGLYGYIGGTHVNYFPRQDDMVINFSFDPTDVTTFTFYPDMSTCPNTANAHYVQLHDVTSGEDWTWTFTAGAALNAEGGCEASYSGGAPSRDINGETINFTIIAADFSLGNGYSILGNNDATISGSLVKTFVNYPSDGETLDTGIQTMAFAFCDASPCNAIAPTPPDNSSQPTIGFFSPANGSTATSTTVNFHVTGHSFATSTIVWLLNNFDNAGNYTVVMPLGSPAGTFDVSTSTIYYSPTTVNINFLSDGSIDTSNLGTATTTTDIGFYIGSLNVMDVLGQQSTTPTTFTVVSSPYSGVVNVSGGILLPATTTATNTSGLSQTSLLSFLNVPNLLKTRVPFAYIFQMYSTMMSAIGTTTVASTIPTGTFTIPWRNYTGTTTISVDMFSTTTITYFLNQTAIDLLRGLMVAVTYFSCGWFLFHDARNRKHII